MRILVISGRYPPNVAGGLERLCAATVESLANRHSIMVVTTPAGEKRAEMGAVPLVRALPFTITNGLRRRALCTVDSSRAARVIRRTISRFQPEMIYLWGADCIPHSSIAVALASDRPVVITAGDYLVSQLFIEYDVFMSRLLGHRLAGRWPLLNWPGWALRLWNRIDPALCLNPSLGRPVAIVWASRYLRDSAPLSPYLKSSADCVIFPASQRVEEPQESRNEQGPAHQAPMVLFVGRVVPEKGVDVAIRGIAELVKRGESPTLRIAGLVSPAMREELLALARGLGLAETTVHFEGPQSSSEVLTLLRRASVVVFPSTWAEPAGIVPLEAAAAGVPVVASRVGGVPEILREDKEALYFSSRDHTECADQIQRLFRDSELRLRLTAAAKDRAQELSFDAYIRRTEQFLLQASST